VGKGSDGRSDGKWEGILEASPEGLVDGSSEGILDGASDGLSDGMSDGFWDGKDRTVDLMESWKVDWKFLQKV
jgi:hypothetical protein